MTKASAVVAAAVPTGQWRQDITMHGLKNIDTMKETHHDNRMLAFASLAGKYCDALQRTPRTEKDVFVGEMLRLLPSIYASISSIGMDELPYDVTEEYYSTYVEEQDYEAVRRSAEALLGEDDIFLETFEEDMKYSETPIAASISEGLADIFQDLYNFSARVRDSEGEALGGALRECKENFEAYWGQTLCNVMRALHNIRYSGRAQE